MVASRDKDQVASSPLRDDDMKRRRLQASNVNLCTTILGMISYRISGYRSACEAVQTSSHMHATARTLSTLLLSSSSFILHLFPQ
jgi:hypothetical protein